MALWLRIDSVKDCDEEEKLYYDNELVRTIKPSKTVIKIGNSEFTGMLFQSDKLLIINDKEFDKAYDYLEGYELGFDKGSKETKANITDLMEAQLKELIEEVRK